MGLLTWAAGRLQLRPTSSMVSGHYLGSEERFVHLFVRHAEEILNSTPSFRVEFPHTEGSVFARLDSTNQHNLHYHNQTEVSLEEISDTALQYWHVLGWTPA